MEKITVGSIVCAVKGKVLNEGRTEALSNVVIDSRKISKGDIFFAIKGENFDGHDFVQKAVDDGAGLVIIHRELELNLDGRDVTVVLVEDTKKALLDLAAYYISTLDIKVIGVTGSTGKTSTKDLIAAALSDRFKVFKTEGNFNNDIGMPLMIFKLDNSYDAAVLEMGMSNLHEIETLTKVAKPEVAVITNVGTSHLENLKTRENILKAKLEIACEFKKDNLLIINGDNDMLHDYNTDLYNVEKIGIDGDYNFKGCRIIINKDSIEFNVCENGQIIEEPVKVPVPGKHNVLNSLLAIAVARNYGLSYDEIRRGIVNLNATSMRLDVIEADGFTIINDAYNASPDSMKAALDVMESYKGRKIAVLGTMKELGTASEEGHREVGRYAKAKGIYELFTLGEFNNEFEEGFGEEGCRSYNSMDDLISDLKNEIRQGDVVLVKASRSMKFENIVKELQKKNN